MEIDYYDTTAQLTDDQVLTFWRSLLSSLLQIDQIARVLESTDPPTRVALTGADSSSSMNWKEVKTCLGLLAALSASTAGTAAILDRCIQVQPMEKLESSSAIQ